MTFPILSISDLRLYAFSTKREYMLLSLFAASSLLLRILSCMALSSTVEKRSPPTRVWRLIKVDGTLSNCPLDTSR